jgi:hypothetical protein
VLFLTTILTFYLASIPGFYLASIPTLFLAHILTFFPASYLASTPTFYRAFFLACNLSGIYFDILPGILLAPIHIHYNFLSLQIPIQIHYPLHPTPGSQW